MSEKLKLDHTNISEVIVTTPDEIKKTVKNRLLKTAGALALAISVPGALIALADNQSPADSNRIVPGFLAPTANTIFDATTSTILVDPTTSILDTTTTASPTTLFLDSGSGGVNTTINVVSDTTPTTLNVESPATTDNNLSGIEFMTYDTDADKILTVGEYVLYKILMTNLENTAKTISLESLFTDSSALSGISNISYTNCGAPSINPSNLSFIVDNIYLAQNSTCEITYDAHVAYTGGASRPYVSMLDQSTGTSYAASSEALYS